MSKFAKRTVADALEEALDAVDHLAPRHAGTVAAARALAAKIDAWDVIVRWAIEDADETKGGRPKVPANDNTSIPTFLKYMEALGLAVERPTAAARGRTVPAPEPEPEPVEEPVGDDRESKARMTLGVITGGKAG